jgi:hypothetical protein
MFGDPTPTFIGNLPLGGQLHSILDHTTEQARPVLGDAGDEIRARRGIIISR